jgi:hypothetical protein
MLLSVLNFLTEFPEGLVQRIQNDSTGSPVINRYLGSRYAPSLPCGFLLPSPVSPV